MGDVVCGKCGMVFRNSKSLAGHCSHRHPIMTIKAICLFCGCGFTTKKQGQKFCSITCFNKSPHKRMMDKTNFKHPPWNKGKNKHTNKKLKEMADNQSKARAGKTLVELWGEESANRQIQKRKETMKKMFSSFTPEQKSNWVRGIFRRNTGITMSEEQKQKISKSKKGHKHTQETIDKIIRNRTKTCIERGYWISDAGRKNQSVKAKENNRNSEKRVGNSVFGTFSSAKSSTPIFFQSSYECMFLLLLEQDNSVTSICRGFSIPYVDLVGDNSKYHPDFYVVYSDGRRELVEVKPHCLLKYKDNQMKFSVGKEYCSKNNLTFRIVSETDLFIQDLAWSYKNNSHLITFGKQQHIKILEKYVNRQSSINSNLCVG